MLKPVLRWSMILASLLAVGPIVSRATAGLLDVDGGPAATLLVGQSTTSGLFAGGLCFAAAAVLAVVGSRVFTLGTGTLCAGLVLAWGGWTLGTIEDVLRRAGAGTDLLTLAVEGGAVCALAAALLVACTMISNRVQPDAVKAEIPKGPLALLVHKVDDDTNPAPGIAFGLVASIAAAVVVGMFLGISFRHGQTIATAVFAGVAAGVAAHYVASSFKVTVTPLVPALGVLLVAAAAPIVAQQMYAGKELISAVYSEQFVGFARPISLDWAAGLLLGVPMGLSWGGAVIDRRAVEKPA